MPLVKRTQGGCIVLASLVLLYHFYYGTFSVFFYLGRPLDSVDSASSSEELQFFVLGDWGVNPAIAEDMRFQRQVANAMQSHPAASAVEFVLSVGDQAYPNGVASLPDARSRFEKAFDGVYGAHHVADSTLLNPLREKQWYLTLGNHDCMGNVTAEYEYAKERTNAGLLPDWHMEQMYAVRKEMASFRLVLLVLDMCTLVCGRQAAGTSAAQEANFRCEGTWGGDNRHNVLAWLHHELGKQDCRSAGVWCVVAGHWPVFSYGGNGPTRELIADLVPVLNEHGVHAYISGHDHNLQHMRRAADGPTSPHYFICGGGGYDIHTDLKPGVDGSLNEGVESKFKATEFGFGLVEVGKNRLRVKFVSAQSGSVLHEGTIHKEIS